MQHDVLLLIAGLAIATYGIRALGLVTGAFIQRSRFAWVLDDLPGVLIVALVASSLAGASHSSWLAAAVALAIAMRTNHVVLTMIGGVAAFAIIANIL